MCLVSCLLLASTAYAQVAGTEASTSTVTTSKAANRALAKSVRRALGRTKGLDPTRIYVKAAGGVVTLSGTLRSQLQIDLAGKTADGVEGVDSVINKITIFNEGGN